MAYKFDCRHFTGYKPCRFKRPCDDCPHYSPVASRILIISLEAMGAVLRSTCLLMPIKRAFPDSHITWLTMKASKPLLENNPLIDRILVLDATTPILLDALEFDCVYAVDKSIEAGAAAMRAKAKMRFGFGIAPNGAIIPLTSDADYQYGVGLDDELKFFKNQKTETQQITESMGLSWERDPYVLAMTDDEIGQAERMREDWLALGADRLFGYNTGCSILYPYKKLTVESSIEMIKLLRTEFPKLGVALLGGPEDSERQARMKAAFEGDALVINTPTTGGLRRGICAMAACDMVFSGCSLGLHMAVALQKPTIAWFGVSCAQEIDLYDRGIKLHAKVSCSPCWRKSCDKEPKCFNMVDPNEIMAATRELLTKFYS